MTFIWSSKVGCENSGIMKSHQAKWPLDNRTPSILVEAICSPFCESQWSLWSPERWHVFSWIRSFVPRNWPWNLGFRGRTMNGSEFNFEALWNGKFSFFFPIWSYDDSDDDDDNDDLVANLSTCRLIRQVEEETTIPCFVRDSYLSPQVQPGSRDELQSIVSSFERWKNATFSISSPIKIAPPLSGSWSLLQKNLTTRNQRASSSPPILPFRDSSHCSIALGLCSQCCQQVQLWSEGKIGPHFGLCSRWNRHAK